MLIILLSLILFGFHMWDYGITLKIIKTGKFKEGGIAYTLTKLILKIKNWNTGKIVLLLYKIGISIASYFILNWVNFKILGDKVYVICVWMALIAVIAFFIIKNYERYEKVK